MEVSERKSLSVARLCCVAVTIALLACGLTWRRRHPLSQGTTADDTVYTHTAVRKTLEIVPIGKDPSFQLSLCQGDCDDDEDCQPGLVCFQRNGPEPVPGCTFPSTGDRFNSMDVCILRSLAGTVSPTFSSVPTTPTPSIVATTTAAPSTSGWGSIHDVPLPPPTITTSAPSAATDTNPPSLSHTWTTITTPPSPPQEDFNFGTDGAINNNNNNDVMPTPQPQKLNIINAPQPSLRPTPDPTLAPSIATTSPTSAFPSTQPTRFRGPTGPPQFTFSPTSNGTNSWQQTYGMTEPFVFEGPPAELPPIEPGLEWLFSTEYIAPRPLHHAGDNGGPAFPLGPCESDCDASSDCAGPLRCYRRDRNDPRPIPGCIGEDLSGDDYCVWPPNWENGRPQRRDWANTGFALKVYWEEGYNWQNETIERYWCITRDYQGSPTTGRCWLGIDQIDCDPRELYIDACSHENPRQRFEFVPVSSDEVLIQAYHENRCFQRTNRRITLERCDETLHTQRWFAIRGGFNERRFELSQKTQSDRCVNQDHHPKPGEVMRMHDCAKTRKPTHLTSWWELF